MDGEHTDSGRRTVEGCVGLSDQNVRDAARGESAVRLEELSFTLGTEDDGVCVRGEVAGARFAGSMDELRGGLTEGHVAADDDVVCEVWRSLQHAPESEQGWRACQDDVQDSAV